MDKLTSFNLFRVGQHDMTSHTASPVIYIKLYTHIRPLKGIFLASYQHFISKKEKSYPVTGFIKTAVMEASAQPSNCQIMKRLESVVLPASMVDAG